MAAEAVAGKTGVDVDGYRDYRGATVVGAWTWLPKLELGVATEMSASEAFQPLIILQRTFWALYGLLGLSAVAIFVFTVVVSRLRREAQKAEIGCQSGQYTLDAKLGAGAMGVVYKGHHAMLRRPTAIKMLDVDKVNDASIQQVRTGSAAHLPAQPSQHGCHLRLRADSRRRLLLRDGVFGRHRPAKPDRKVWPAA